MTGKTMIAMVFAVVMAMLMNTATCADMVEAKGALASGDAAVTETIVDTNTTIIPASTVTQNITVAPVVSTTEKEDKDDEKPITETIRTYIEDGVKSVKHAISKIGKFVGEFFEDTPTNSTVPATPSANKTTVISVSSTVIPSSTPSPSSVAPQ